MEPASEAVEENLETRCEVCGAALTKAEIDTAREAGRPFVCTVHGVEEMPVVPDEEAGVPPPDAAETP